MTADHPPETRAADAPSAGPDPLPGGAGAAGPGAARSGAVRTAIGLVAVVATAAALLGIGVRARFGGHVAVDEPQYLLTALSIFEDLDLDITDELAERRWAPWAGTEALPVQTEVLADGTQISPHDPLLPILLAVPMGLGGWIAAKAAMALMAGALAALTLWTAVRRFAVPVRLAAGGVLLASASPPLAVYGQQVYPELPAALAAVAALAVLTGPAFAGGARAGGAERPPRIRRDVAVFGLLITALPWLSVKYAPVAAVLALLGLWRLRADRGTLLSLAGGFAAMGAAYLAVHRLVWGGWTVYASGDHFQASGEFGVMGFDPDYAGRAVRLVGLMADRGYGLAAWQPAWLLLLPAVGYGLLPALRRRRSGGPAVPGDAPAGTSRGTSHGASRAVARDAFHSAALLLPLAAGWLTATFVALTMNGHWWPGRQTVVVLPLALLLVLALLRDRPGLRPAGLVLGLAGLVNHAWLLADGYAVRITWVSGFEQVGSPLYRAVRPVLPDYRLGWDGFWPLHLGWVLVSLLLIAYGTPYLTKGRTHEVDPDPGDRDGAGPGRSADVRPDGLRRR
ncbi:hypothetical protein [Planomonospora venezuelensis]|uniref:Glycosyltransferase RgtA/B/C/D-like domain-containing protein n=1 Tax=Planomonospora venezuelensis TaxID=1999 RepID=A0A841D0G1_PLAVE|nr:hypothetical protein [Planomonospora venezuelensis]MBB5962999.1 hypothetical protein [Planomonospora venezuelensis]GIN00567.1 hypothetical protein Pve01_22250 [Planomonospora venezuelensis]